MVGYSKAKKNTKNRTRPNRNRSRRVKRSNSVNKNVANKNNRSNNNSSNKKTLKRANKRLVKRSQKKGKKMNNNLKGGGSRPHFRELLLFDKQSEFPLNRSLTYEGNDNLENTNIYSVSH